MADIESQIDKLSEKIERTQDSEEVDSMRRTLKTATLRKNLASNPALASLIAYMRKRDESFSTILSNKENLTDLQRAEYFARRKEVRWFLSFFDSAESTLASMEERLTYLLSDTVENE